MKKTKGFTLIELLAVIVVLAVIALITTPIIMGIIKKAKKGAYQDSLYGILKAADEYAATQLLAGDYSGEILDLSTETKLNYQGKRPLSGMLEIFANGDTILVSENAGFCYIKRRNTDQLEVIDQPRECNIRVARNLVKNGYFEYGDNTNFPQAQYQDGKLTLVANRSKNVMTDDLIPFVENQKYQLTYTLKGNTSAIH